MRRHPIWSIWVLNLQYIDIPYEHMFPTPLVNFDTNNNDLGGWNKMAITFIFVELTFNYPVADLFVT